MIGTSRRGSPRILLGAPTALAIAAVLGLWTAPVTMPATAAPALGSSAQLSTASPSAEGAPHPHRPQVRPPPPPRHVHTPLARASQYAHTRVLLLADTDDEGSALFAGAADRMRDALAVAGHRPGAFVTPGAHSWSWVNAQWPLTVRFLTQG